MKTNLKILAAATLFWCAADPCHARTISWYSVVGDTLKQSDGTTNLSSSFNFQIGGFSSGFVPTLSNMNQWAANWVAFDIATNGDGWNPGITYFTSSGTANATGNPSIIQSSVTASMFDVGQQAYLWVFDSQSLQPTSQWALVTSAAWLYPASDLLNPNPVEWSLASATTPVIGGVNNSQASGSAGYTPPPGSFSLQTHAVPEPGTAMLIALAGLFLRLRRGLRARTAGSGEGVAV